jgi:hypothetical protein
MLASSSGSVEARLSVQRGVPRNMNMSVLDDMIESDLQYDDCCCGY